MMPARRLSCSCTGGRRTNLDVHQRYAYDSESFWGVGWGALTIAAEGGLRLTTAGEGLRLRLPGVLWRCGGGTELPWVQHSRQLALAAQASAAAVVGLRLDVDQGQLDIYLNGRHLGLAASGLQVGAADTGFCWCVTLSRAGDSVRIGRPSPPPLAPGRCAAGPHPATPATAGSWSMCDASLLEQRA
jgi:hypothetical protein